MVIGYRQVTERKLLLVGLLRKEFILFFRQIWVWKKKKKKKKKKNTQPVGTHASDSWSEAHKTEYVLC